MSRIFVPATVDAAPAESQAALQTIEKQIGLVPNLFRALSTSPAALQGYLGLSGALNKGSIRPETRERIALAVAEVNGCDYCLSAHTYFARNLAKLGDDEITANRNGASNDPTADAAVHFAVTIARQRGHVSDADIAKFKAAGFTEGQVVEVAALVAVSTLTNYINEVVKTEIDFPLVAARRAA